MLHPSTKKLIDKLAEMTAQNKIAWTEGDDGAAVYDTEGYRVTLPGDVAAVVLSDALGKELERASLEDLSAVSDEAGRSYVDIVGDMKREASRIARGTEAAIDRVLAGLSDAPAIAPVFGEAGDADGDPEDVVDETASLEAEEAAALETSADEGEAAPGEVAEAPDAIEPAPTLDEPHAGRARAGAGCCG